MSIIEKDELNKIQFYLTTKYKCGYIPDQSAQSIVATPYKKIKEEAYNELIKKGFRRSGQYIYKPNCGVCNACVPIRININNFRLSRSQKRVYKNHNNLSSRILPLKFNEEHFELYAKYQKNRHLTFTKTNDDISDYNDFLIKSNVSTKIIEFRDKNELKIVSIVDFLDNGLSAVYTFFECDDKNSSFGTYSILSLIDLCKKKKITYLYLGYWINECQKMAYKIHFKDYELLIDDLWQSNSD